MTEEIRKQTQGTGSTSNTANNCSSVQNRGCISINQEEDNIIGVAYSGEIIITTKEHITNQDNTISKLSTERDSLIDSKNKYKKSFEVARRKHKEVEEELIREQEKSKKLQLDIDRAKELLNQYTEKIKELQKGYSIIAEENRRLHDVLSKFQNNQTSKLTDAVKRVITEGYNKGVTPTYIHNYIKSSGYDISYETVRKFYRSLENR